MERTSTPQKLVDGVTLRVRARQHRLKLGEVLDLVIQTARALVAAHQAGIVHRDIKPETSWFRTDGYVKVLDFGLAKLTSPAAPEIGTRAAAQAPANTDAGCDPRHGRLHVAGAGARPGSGCAHRHLVARRLLHGLLTGEIAVRRRHRAIPSSRSSMKSRPLSLASCRTRRRRSRRSSRTL
jgi:serine/threonine protein kinase